MTQNDLNTPTNDRRSFAALPFPFNQQNFCRYEPIEQSIDEARVLVIDNLLRDERDLSAVARDEWGETLAAEMRRERLIAGMAIENILNNISRLVKSPTTRSGARFGSRRGGGETFCARRDRAQRHVARF